MKYIKLYLPKEFDFEENINYLSRSNNECLYHVENNRIYKAISIREETYIIEVSQEEEKVLTINFLGVNHPPTSEINAEVIHYVKEWFDLDRDLLPFYTMAQNDPLLKKAVNSFFGLRVIGIPDLFEALCWGILGQQINLTFAYTLKRRLVESFGSKVEHEGVIYWIFPTPSEIAALSVDDLTGLRMTIKKAEYLIKVAQLMVEGKLSKELLLEAGSFKDAEKMLVKIRGIGPWTANYVLMRCLRYPAAFPIDDVGLHNALKLLLDRDSKPSKDEILKLAENWTNWEAYATFYLWRFLY